VVTVGLDEGRVELALVAGRLVCPGCGGVLRRWGWARRRLLRDAGGGAWLRPRRSRCGSCGLSHVLLPPIALLRRADVVAVIGRALALAAAGAGARTVAKVVGRSAETVRGWLRRFRARAERLRVVFTALLVDLAPDPVPPAAAGNPVADAVAAIAGAGVAARSRWPGVVGEVPVWGFAVAVSHGRLLAPGWPPELGSVGG
jgi:uncharacterized protein DUF6431